MWKFSMSWGYWLQAMETDPDCVKEKRNQWLTKLWEDGDKTHLRSGQELGHLQETSRTLITDLLVEITSLALTSLA